MTQGETTYSRLATGNSYCTSLEVAHSFLEGRVAPDELFRKGDGEIVNFSTLLRQDEFIRKTILSSPLSQSQSIAVARILRNKRERQRLTQRIRIVRRKTQVLFRNRLFQYFVGIVSILLVFWIVFLMIQKPILRYRVNKIIRRLDGLDIAVGDKEYRNVFRKATKIAQKLSILKEKEQRENKTDIYKKMKSFLENRIKALDVNNHLTDRYCLEIYQYTLLHDAFPEEKQDLDVLCEVLNIEIDEKLNYVYDIYEENVMNDFKDELMPDENKEIFAYKNTLLPLLSAERKINLYTKINKRETEIHQKWERKHSETMAEIEKWRWVIRRFVPTFYVTEFIRLFPNCKGYQETLKNEFKDNIYIIINELVAMIESKKCENPITITEISRLMGICEKLNDNIIKLNFPVLFQWAIDCRQIVHNLKLSVSVESLFLKANSNIENSYYNPKDPYLDYCTYYDSSFGLTRIDFKQRQYFNTDVWTEIPGFKDRLNKKLDRSHYRYYSFGEKITLSFYTIDCYGFNWENGFTCVELYPGFTDLSKPLIRKSEMSNKNNKSKPGMVSVKLLFNVHCFNGNRYSSLLSFLENERLK